MERNNCNNILQQIETSINQLELPENPALLYDPIRYALSMGGKRIRPYLCLLSGKIFDEKNYLKTMPAAIGIEIFHNFTLLHDDIMDNAPIRRGKDTVYKKWNSNIAILSGDAMFALACNKILETDTPHLKAIMNEFLKASIEVCEGQQWDMDFETAKNITENDYLKMIRLKTAVLLASSMKIGAIAANASDIQCENIYQFALNIGLSFQLMDDYLDAFGDEKKFGKKTGGDITCNKKTFLYIKALEQADEKIKKELLQWFDNTVTYDNAKKIQAVVKIFRNLQVPETTQKAIIHYYEKAKDHLKKLNLHNDAVNELQDFCEKLIQRDF